jgi:chromosomal replication initiation ATPase DnaA
MSGAGQLLLPLRPPPRAAAPPIAAASNAAARAWLARTADWPQRRLALWGPRGAGKSLLLAQWAHRHGAALIAGPALRFLPPATPLAIDDADRAPAHDLLHMLNAAAEAGLAVLLAAEAAPARWATTLPDLSSRLRATTSVAIEAPEDALLAALLARLLGERQLRPSPATIAWLLARLPRRHDAVITAVARLDRAAQTLGVPIAPALARDVLPDLLADLPDAADEDFATPAASGPSLL